MENIVAHADLKFSQSKFVRLVNVLGEGPTEFEHVHDCGFFYTGLQN